MNDFWYQGYGAAVQGCDWLRAVAGRFLRSWERAALAAGWREGRADAETYRRDMELDPFAVRCDETIPY